MHPLWKQDNTIASAQCLDFRLGYVRTPSKFTKCVTSDFVIQQQQQHSLFSQANRGRLEMKPKRNKGHSSSTLIASLQALLSKTISLEIFQSLRSLLTDSSHVSLGLPLPLFGPESIPANKK